MTNGELRSHFLMGSYHWTLGEPELAKFHYTESYRIRSQNNASRHPNTAARLFKLGYLKFYEAGKVYSATSVPDVNTLSNIDSDLFNQSLLEEAM